MAKIKLWQMSKPSAGAWSGPYLLVSIIIKLDVCNMYIYIHMDISGLPYCSNIVQSHSQCGRHIIELGGGPSSLLLYTLHWIIYCTELYIRGRSHMTSATKGGWGVSANFKCQTRGMGDGGDGLGMGGMRCGGDEGTVGQYSGVSPD